MTAVIGLVGAAIFLALWHLPYFLQERPQDCVTSRCVHRLMIQRQEFGIRATPDEALFPTVY
jgi:hypothetical protein